jgi:sugar O-acyltransferase (sialic acid O-acetyltransferase NeuD family)
MEPLVIVGSGGFARETAETVASINALRPTWRLLGFVDDNAELHGSSVDGVAVLGPVEQVATLDAFVVVCTGSPSNYFSRKRIVDRLALHPERYATIVHPSAQLAPSTTIGRGTVVLATAVATASVSVGSHVAVMPAAVFTHDDVVDDYATLGSGARLAGGVVVGEGAYIGSGALVREGSSIGAWSLVGMGAVVTHDVPSAEVWAGVPARRLRRTNAFAA